jgi:hypothetical protein
MGGLCQALGLCIADRLSMEWDSIGQPIDGSRIPGIIANMMQPMVNDVIVGLKTYGQRDRLN